MKFTIIHPSRGNVIDSERTITRWFLNSSKTHPFEYFLCVDSDDPLIEEYRELQQRLKGFKFNLVEAEGRGVVSAINSALKVSTGDITWITNDGAQVSDGWDKTMIPEHIKEEARISASEVVLSIIVLTIPKREEEYDLLKQELQHQIIQANLDGKVEIITVEGSSAPVGAKRNEGIRRATGDFVCHMDDDDWPVENYIITLYDAIVNNPDIDVVSIEVKKTTNGDDEEIIKCSIIPLVDDYIAPNHLCPIRRTIASKFKFQEINVAEDFTWARDLQRAGVLTKQIRIPFPIYHYRYSKEGTATQQKVGKVNLFFNYYKDKDKKRNEELYRCVLRNAENSHIDRIYLIYDPEDGTGHEFFNSMEFVPHTGRPTFETFFSVARMKSEENDINIIANSDIFFDETIEKVKGMASNECYALSRHDVSEFIESEHKSELYNHPDSQDAWIFKGKIKPIGYADFAMGVPGCDNRIAHEIKEAGYHISNPSKTIKAHHLHMNTERSYVKNGQRTVAAVEAPYHLMWPEEL